MIWHEFYHKFLRALAGCSVLLLFALALHLQRSHALPLSQIGLGVLLGLMGLVMALAINARSHAFLKHFKSLRPPLPSPTKTSLSVFHLEFGSYVATGVSTAGVVVAAGAEGFMGGLTFAGLILALAIVVVLVLRAMFRIMDAQYLIKASRG